MYPQQATTKLPVTDLYIKFEPSNLEQLRALEAAIDAFDFTASAESDNDPFWVDYPLDREDPTTLSHLTALCTCGT